MFIPNDTRPTGAYIDRVIELPEPGVSAQAVITHEAQRAKIGRILHRAMRRRGIAVSGDARVHAGHWYVRSGEIWIRSTDALSMRMM